MTTAQPAALALGECERCLAGTHGNIKDGRCVCCSQIMEEGK